MNGHGRQTRRESFTCANCAGALYRRYVRDSVVSKRFRTRMLCLLCVCLRMQNSVSMKCSAQSVTFHSSDTMYTYLTKMFLLIIRKTDLNFLFITTTLVYNQINMFIEKGNIYFHIHIES